MLIYRDSREKFGWDFSFYGFKQETKALKTGDYTCLELPDLVIERKASSGELAINLGKKWKQFHAELERMSHYKWPYIICEFSFDNLTTFPVNSGIPEKHWKYLRMSPNFLKKRLYESCDKYGIQLLFFNSSQEALREVVNIIHEKFPKR